MVKEQCDSSRLCRKVLMAFENCSEHVFGDLLDRMPKDVRKQIEDVVFPRPVPLALREQDPEEFQSRMQIYDALVQDAVSNIREIFRLNKTRLWQPECTAWCYRHERQCQVWSAPQSSKSRVQLNVAGSTCTDWSQIGSRNGLSGESTLPFCCWLHEQAARAVPLLLHECTPRFPPQLLRDVLTEEDYEVTSVIAGPGMMGIPNDRQRIFTLAA